MKIEDVIAIGVLVSMIAGGIAYFQSSSDADEQHKEIELESDHEHLQMQLDRESGDLRTRMTLIELRLDFYRVLADERELSDSEEMDLVLLQQERSTLLERLAELGKM